MMSLTTIKNVLQELKPELEAKYHVSALGLLGSVAVSYTHLTLPTILRV